MQGHWNLVPELREIWAGHHVRIAAGIAAEIERETGTPPTKSGVKSGKTSLARDEPLDVTPAFPTAAAAR